MGRIDAGRTSTAGIADRSSGNACQPDPTPTQAPSPGGGTAPGFRLSDAEEIAARVSGVRAVAPLRMVGVKAVYLQEDWSTQAIGTTADYFAVAGWTFAEGRPFTDAEFLGARSVCVLGNTVVDELFGQQDPVGARIRLKSLTCEVVGVLAAKGQGAMGQDQDSVVVLPQKAEDALIAELLESIFEVVSPFWRPKMVTATG